jgi:hypothetical protein
VPVLTPDKVAQYSTIFEMTGAGNGYLVAQTAKQIFDRSRLPPLVLGKIWHLSDSQNRGALDRAEFVIAMHLLASYKSGAMRGVPNILSPWLYEVAARREPQHVETGSHFDTSNRGFVTRDQPFLGNAREQPLAQILNLSDAQILDLSDAQLFDLSDAQLLDLSDIDPDGQAWR